MYEELFDLKEEHFPESPVIEKLQNDIQKTRKKIEGLNSSNDYVNIANRLKSIQQTNSKKRLQGYKGNIDSPNVFATLDYLLENSFDLDLGDSFTEFQ